MVESKQNEVREQQRTSMVDDSPEAVTAAQDKAVMEETNDSDDSVVYGELIDEGDENEETEGNTMHDGPDDSVRVFRSHTAETLAVHSSPLDMNLIASGACDDRAILFDIEQGRDLAELDGQGESVSCVRFSYDGKFLAIGSENGTISVMFMQGATAPQSVLDGPSAAISFLAWHPRGPVLLAGSEDNSVYMWNASKGQFMMAFIGHEKSVTCGFFSGDGKKVVTASLDSSIRVWNPTTGTTEVRIQANQPGIGGTFHSDEIQCIGIGYVDTPLAKIVVSGGSTGTVFVTNLESGQVLTQLPSHEGGVETVAFSPPSVRPYMVATAGADGIIRVRDMESGAERCTFTHLQVVAKVIWHPTKPIIVSGSSAGTICLWNVLTGQKLAELRGHSDYITDISFASNTQAVVSTSGDGTVRVFDIRTLVR